MTTYNTGNPLGSAAAKDLYDNAQNFDHLSLDTENETWPDRLGNQRTTWYGIEKKQIEQFRNMAISRRILLKMAAPLALLTSAYAGRATASTTDGMGHSPK